MGRTKYFCDYCNKSFNDDPKARSLHLNSMRHLQLKDEHYEMFQDADTRLEKEKLKQPCQRFQSDGFCRFGSSCRFSHLSPEQMDQLYYEAHSKNVVPQPLVHIPRIAEWVSRHSQRSTPDGARMSHNVNFPPEQLPPSLRPFDVSECYASSVTQWGDDF